MTIPSGSTVFTVYGLDAPTELGGKEHLIGTLVTTSETIKSFYGDDKLYFRHQRAEDDIKLKPEWEDYYVRYDTSNDVPHPDRCHYDESEEHIMYWSCPFASLFK